MRKSRSVTVDDSAIGHWLLLAEFCEHRPGPLRGLQTLGTDPEAILGASDCDWRRAGVDKRVLANRCQWSRQGRRHKCAQAARKAQQLLAEHQATLLVLGSAGYPSLLAEIFDPPPLLYVAGAVDALERPQIGLVGSRRCSASGARAARQLATGLVAAGFSVCSGMALGIDAAAHRAALDAGGRTVAVMGTGIDGRYPRRHAELAESIACHGALVTEFPTGTPPLPHHFPLRNRLISGMSVGVLVVEAGLRSGSLITARLALDQNREVFAVPHSIFHPGGRGCLLLLSQGAKLVADVEDVLEEVGTLRVAAERGGPGSASAAQPPPAARAVWEQLGYEPVSIDELVSLGVGDASSVIAALQALELEGLVEQRNGSFMRCL